MSLDSDLDSEQWDHVESLLERFPDGGRVLPMIRSSIEEEDVDFERDVEPALGPTVELVWLDFENGGKNVVALTQPDDREKLRALAAKSDEPLVVGDVGDWSALAETQALIDRFGQALDAGALADDEDFGTALDELPESALAKVYVDGREASAALRSALAARPSGAMGLDRIGQLVAGAAALEAADDGFRLTGYLRSLGLPPEATDAAGLLDEVPAGAFLALSGNSSSFDADDVPSAPELDQLERELGLSLSELASLFEGKAVFYVRPGGLLPELTLLLEPPDADAAKARLDTLTARLPGQRSETAIGDVQATSITFGRFAVVYAAFDGRLAITTLPDGIRTLREGGDKLVDEDRYESAVEAAGVADGEDVVLYADLEQALRLVEQVAGTSGAVPPDVARNLEPLRALVASAGGEGDEATFRVFLEIE